MDIVFFARVTGGTGAVIAPVGSGAGLTPNPLAFNGIASAVFARTGAGVYTVTFATALPEGEYLYEVGCIGAAASGNAQVSVAGAVATVLTSLAAVATDENYWIRVSRVLGSDS